MVVAFAKFRRTTVTFVMCLSVHMGRLGCHWKDFHEIWYWVFLFENLSRKFNFH